MGPALQNFPRRLLAVLSSYGLACALFILLILLAWRGTLYQIEHGIFAAQQKYFTSIVVLENLPGPLPLPLPGAYSVLVLLSVNLLLGGILRARKGWGHAGILVTHSGILLLLGGGFVTHHFSETGQITLREGETTASFELLDKWELLVKAQGQDASAVFPLDGLGRSQDPLRHSGPASLPFTVGIQEYWPNAARDDRLEERPKSPDPMRNLPAVRLRALVDEITEARFTIWAGDPQPYILPVGARDWEISVRKQRKHLPFSLTLDRFQLSQHPGTRMSRAVRSELTRKAGEIAEPAIITMNQPLRVQGYTIYQTSWGPPESDPDISPYTVLSVSRNPAEPFPLYACLVIGGGMALHFTIRLRAHLRKLQGGTP